MFVSVSGGATTISRAIVESASKPSFRLALSVTTDFNVIAPISVAATMLFANTGADFSFTPHTRNWTSVSPGEVPMAHWQWAMPLPPSVNPGQLAPP